MSYRSIAFCFGIGVVGGGPVVAQTATPSSVAVAPPTNAVTHKDSSASARPATDSQPKAADPFAFADFTWLNGNSRQKTSVLDTKYFTGEFRADINYVGDFNHPKDHTLVGTSELGR